MLPLAVKVLAQPDILTKTIDPAEFMPRMFAVHTGPGGERVRSLYYSMLAEYMTNVDDAYATHGVIKSALFISFVDLCCAFTPSPSDESCAIIAETTTAFMKSIRTLLKTNVYKSATDKVHLAGDGVSVTDQLSASAILFPEKCDTASFVQDALDFLVAPDYLYTTKSAFMYRVLFEYATTRNTPFYNYAHHVRAQLHVALREEKLFVANVFLRYFIYTVSAVCQLSVGDWSKAREMIKADAENEAVSYFRCKIDSQMRGNFDDMCAYMLAPQSNLEERICVEYNRYVSCSRDALPSMTRPSPVERFRPEMTIPDDAVEKKSGVCSIL